MPSVSGAISTEVGSAVSGKPRNCPHGLLRSWGHRFTHECEQPIPSPPGIYRTSLNGTEVRILFLALDVDMKANRGDAIHTRSIAASLARAGNEVLLVVGSNGLPDPVPGLRTSVRPDSGYLAVVSHIRKAVRTLRPDVIYERRYSPKIGMTVSRMSGTPFVAEINGIVEDEAAMAGRPLPDTPVQRAKGSIRRRMLKRAAAVVTVTDGLRDIMIQRFGLLPERVFVVENGVDPTLFRPMDLAESRRALGLSADRLVCFVGNLVPWQGLVSLVNAMSALPSQVHLLLVGDGPERASLLKQVGNLGLQTRVRHLGSIPHEEVPVAVAAADVCVAPFSFDRNATSGVSALKVLEYIACGRPIVVTDIPGPRELVRTLGCGLVVPPGDPEALAHAIGRALEEPAYRTAAIRASEIVRKENSWDRTARHVLGVLETVASKRRPSA